MKTENLIRRIESLERQTVDYEEVVPVLVYIASSGKTLEEAKEDYKKRNGFDLPQGAQIIVIEKMDCRRPDPLIQS